MSRMKSLMRSFVYWPRMDCDIEYLVKNCRACVLAEKSPPIKLNLGLRQIFHGKDYTLILQDL